MDDPLLAWLAELGLVGPIEVIQTRSGALLALSDREVIKLHRRGTDLASLDARLRAAATTPQFLAPASQATLRAPALVTELAATSDFATRWPRAETLAATQLPPDSLWFYAGNQLSQLHATPPQPFLPTNGAAGRVARAVASLNASEMPAARTFLQVAATLPNPARLLSGARLVHGDWHLGQLGRLDDQGWRLLDPDDLGTGNPLSDFGRIAAFRAAGFVPESAWQALVDGYRAGPSNALPDGPIWPVLDAYARWGLVVAAAGLIKHPQGEMESELLTEFTQMANRMSLE